MVKAFYKKWISSGAFLFEFKLAIVLWFGLSTIALLVHHTSINNYYIYEHVFSHALAQKNLYLNYPEEYNDVFLYGPIFSIVIAPFAILPTWLGSSLWVLSNAALLMFAIWKLPLTNKWKTAILVLSSHEMMNHAGYFQSNALVASCILLGFVYTCNGKDKWALFFILLATFMKIYGIVGFAFFFFSKNKGKYILWTVIWSFVFAALPLLITTYDFLCQSYVDWLHALQFKAEKNVVIINNSQDISVMGMIRRIFKYPSFNSLWITVPAAFLILTQFIRIKDFGDTRYRLYLLCSVMIATVIFSTGSETPTYIIAFPAVCIWYVMQKHTKLINSIFIFALILTSFSHSDLLTPYFRNHIARPYSLKALPCFVVWLILFFQIMMRQYKNIPTDRLTEI